MTNLIPQEYIAQTIKLKNNIEQGFLALGERLHNIKTEELWQGTFNSYQEFLEEMKMSESTDSKLRAIYNRFILEYQLQPEQIAPIGWSSLYEISSKVNDKDKALVLIEKAHTLKRIDLQDEIREMKHGEHECSGETITFVKCGVCNRLVRQ